MDWTGKLYKLYAELTVVKNAKPSFRDLTVGQGLGSDKAAPPMLRSRILTGMLSVSLTGKVRPEYLL
jgi:hypothetical protein